jgi:LmbE family N-acetylglucosaminyl deacetylase
MSREWIFIAEPEPELVPYQGLQRLPVGSLLVLAPHPDDEVFGCGGLLALAAAQGVDARVTVVTGGGQGGDVCVRQAESLAALGALGWVDAPQRLSFWGFNDREVQPDDVLVNRIQRALAEHPATWLLAPSPFEVHPDHRAVCMAAIAAAALAKVQLGFYEVGQPLAPSLLVDITPVLALKKAALACFPSQLAMQRYDEQILALNRYRAYTLGPAVTHAEAYWFPELCDTVSVSAVQAALQRMLGRRLGLR